MAEEADASPALRAALGYWQGLGAPVEHVARRLGLSVDAVRAALPQADPPPVGLAGYPSAVPWERRTATALAADGLRRRPDDATLLFVPGEGALTAGEVRELVSRTAAGLVAAGVGPEAGVAVDATQRLEGYLVVLAALLLGAPIVRLSGVTDAPGLADRLAAAPVAMTFSAHAGWAEGVAAAGARVGFDGAEATDFADWLDRFLPLETLPEAAVSPATTALVGFTSGSTGTPTCVRTSHEAVFRATEAMQALFGFDADDIFCTSTDFSALSAFRSMVTLPLLTGGRAVLPSALAREAPLALAEECRDFAVTRLTALPSVLRGLIAARERLGPSPLPALRTVFSGSGVLDQATCDRFEAAYGVPAVDYYGGREFATAVYADPGGGQTVSSGGGAPCNCLVRIVDDDGRLAPTGQPGRIMVHSDCLMQDLAEPADPAWRGWHDSGDLGRLDAAGRLEVVGRRREVIKARDGSLVFPMEVQALAMSAPGVEEAVVFGHMTEDGVEHLIAAVVLSEPDFDIEQRLRAHVLALAGQHRVPSRVFALPELPRAASAKVDGPKLRALLAPRLADLS